MKTALKLSPAAVCIGTIAHQNCGTPGTYEAYFCWVGFEHSSATYLTLLGADTINWNRSSFRK